MGPRGLIEFLNVFQGIVLKRFRKSIIALFCSLSVNKLASSQDAAALFYFSIESFTLTCTSQLPSTFYVSAFYIIFNFVCFIQ